MNLTWCLPDYLISEYMYINIYKYSITYSVMKLSSNNSVAVARFSGSGSKQRFMKALAVSDISAGISGWIL